eukprot:6450014-Prymnesium_polylepis.1
MLQPQPRLPCAQCCPRPFQPPRGRVCEATRACRIDADARNGRVLALVAVLERLGARVAQPPRWAGTRP